MNAEFQQSLKSFMLTQWDAASLAGLFVDMFATPTADERNKDLDNLRSDTISEYYAAHSSPEAPERED